MQEYEYIISCIFFIRNICTYFESLSYAYIKVRCGSWHCKQSFFIQQSVQCTPYCITSRTSSNIYYIIAILYQSTFMVRLSTRVLQIGFSIIFILKINLQFHTETIPKRRGKLNKTQQKVHIQESRLIFLNVKALQLLATVLQKMMHEIEYICSMQYVVLVLR